MQPDLLDIDAVPLANVESDIPSECVAAQA
jgi:hypothetical protein